MLDTKQGCHDYIYKAEINLVFYTMLEHIGLLQFEVSTWFCTCFALLANMKVKKCSKKAAKIFIRLYAKSLPRQIRGPACTSMIFSVVNDG